MKKISAVNMATMFSAFLLTVALASAGSAAAIFIPLASDIRSDLSEQVSAMRATMDGHLNAMRTTMDGHVSAIRASVERLGDDAEANRRQGALHEYVIKHSLEHDTKSTTSLTLDDPTLGTTEEPG